MAEITTIQMYASTSADAAATVDIPADGVLVGVEWAAMFGGLDTIEDSAQAEISFNSTNQRTTNDARAAVSAIKVIMTGVTTGMGSGGINKDVDLRDGVAVQGGERLYMHTVGSAGVTIAIIAVLRFRFRTVRRASTRRR